MSDNAKSNNATRRLLLKGLAGGAGIYTLPVGATVANGSIGACVQRSQSSTAPKAVLTDVPDTWVRVQLPYYVQGEHRFIQWKGTWYVVQGNGPYTASEGSSLLTGPIQTAPQGSFYGLVDYAGTQGPLEVYPADQVVMQPVAGHSCWNSAVPGGPRADTRNVLTGI